MSTLQPIHALNLGSVQQQAFVKFYQTLPEKPLTTVRIFDRNDYYSVHGADATTASREVFSSIANIKRMGIEPNLLDYLVLSKGNFEILIRKLLLVRRYRVEIYVSEGSTKGSEWVVKYKGSPGFLSQLEEILGEGLGASENTPCLMAVNIKTDPVSKSRLLGVACVTAGDYSMRVSEFTDDELLTELETITVQAAPAECVVTQADGDDYKALNKVMERTRVTVTKLKKSEFSAEGLIQDLNRLLKFKAGQQQDANAFAETRMDLAMTSLSATIRYMSLLSDATNFGRFRLESIKADCYLHMDAAVLSALNVFPELGDSHAPSRSLYGLLDRCRTQQGKRLLAQWLRQPLRDINLIEERQEIVEVLMKNSALRLQLHEELRRQPDLQALARRLARKKASLHDCYRIYQAINRLPPLLQCLAESNNATVHSAIAEPISELSDDLNKFQQMIEATVDMDAVDRGDYLVKPSFDDQLQSLAEQLDKLQATAEKELNRAARDLGLDAGKTAKIKMESNPQIGFYFRVTLKEEQSLRGNKKYKIIDAVKGGVRFKTDALERITEDHVETKKMYEREQDKVVSEIIAIAAGYTECLFCLSHVISRLDVLVSFAVAGASAPRPYCRPQIIAETDELVLEELRHPCLEVQDGVSYIPNDVVFNRDSCIMHIVTGANMGGKSTWMRSCGAAVLMAMAGAPVACARARVPRLRAVCARVGAADAEQRGHSTFMIEMIDTANILKTATPDSLVLIDELGRGTSTYEGCGIAWAIAEKLATETKCFCLFATHYHELTRLSSLPGVVNSHAEASVVDGRLLLLHRILPGPAARSLGLHVARLADLPHSVIEYAEAKQAQLETNLFELESATKSEETAEGQKIITEFLQKCKTIHETIASDEEMMKEIEILKRQVLEKDNQYVKSVLSH